MLPLTTFILAIASCTLARAGPLSRPAKFDWSSTKALIAFGDSYTYVQGTLGHQNFSFIGDQFNLAYDAKTLFSNKIVQNQTATAEGGPNWVEYLTNCGVHQGLTSPQNCKKQLWDFAFAGADISTEYTPLHHNFTVSLVDQINQFRQHGHPALQHNLPGFKQDKTLIALWIGINDINDSAKYAVDFPTFYKSLTDTLFASVETLYRLGYRSYLFMNLPPLDRTPGNQAKSNPSPSAAQVGWYNAALADQAAAFGEKHKEAQVMLFDAHARLAAMLDEPRKYGIVNTTNFCAGYDQPDIAVEYEKYGCPTSLEQYFWFNSGHMTSHVHEVLAGKVERWLQG
ncbi:Lipase GDSL [Penicillium cf. griseofulvum]|uniref:Lipase GDSL n=1 Tax=Penicillium cf. griseofulvum TaxID=2972120 RepID=A0A9W9JDV0_9EURO|nr:Lipase GDSL [Penicillium cf. griseofulvum]KAJ5445440.1 Lipase GDSL [Penicillium cf. griseofulvum]KAJ5447160.1 Lipase GDSL [Penicillium cf. griseofulvum]